MSDNKSTSAYFPETEDVRFWYCRGRALPRTSSDEAIKKFGGEFDRWLLQHQADGAGGGTST